MAGDSKISGLPTSSTLTGAEEFPNIQSSTTKKVTLTAIYNYLITLVATLTTAQTITNKNIVNRVRSVTSASTLTVDSDSFDCISITAQAATLTVSNPTGTPNDFQGLVLRIKDDGTARAISWGTNYLSSFVTLPTTTVISKVLTVGFWYDSVKGKWSCVSVLNEL